MNDTPTPITDTLFNEIEPEFCDLDAWDYFCEMTALAKQMERELIEARRLAEKYRYLSCDSQEEADETLLPWENNQPTEP